jgi:ketosteroid isomerase-like protein
LKINLYLLDVVQQAYAAFGRHDITALVRRTPEEVANFFKTLSQADDIHAFEPREFIEAGEHVTVLGCEKTTAVDTQKLFETEWVHVFTVKSGKITRWRGFFNTAARYS